LSIGANLRNWGFWISDRLKGSPIARHCEDIERELTTGSLSASRLEALLQFAVEHTPFYSNLRGFGSLQDFPVINKNTIKAQYDAFRSDTFVNVKLHAMHTSGSTGTPFAVLQNPDKRHRVLAEVICFSRRAGYEVGDRFLFTRVWTEHNRKSRLAALRDNTIQFDISSLDSPCLESLRTLLRTDPDIKCMMGYPSTFGPFMWYMDTNGDTQEDFHLHSIISISEKLPPQVRSALKRQFGCNVVSRYSNQENGVLAQQCLDHDEYHLNTASYFFEFLELDRDFPARPGEPARMVVTDLFNRAMPLIRYDTGDVVVRETLTACGSGADSLSDIGGRLEDFIFDTADRPLSPSVPGLYFWPFTKLKQIQFIQEHKGVYSIVVNGALEHYKDEEFTSLAKSFLGSDAQVSVVHVDHIPMLDSGKFKAVFSRYKPAR